MKTICIIPCGATKIWDKYPNAGPTLARNVYIGPFAHKCQVYAQTFYPDSYYILSAKHGFLRPDDIVPENYNVSFKEPASLPITIPELVEIAQAKGLSAANHIIVIAGSEYVQIVENVFMGIVISEPLKGCRGNGEMMGKMKTAIQNKKPLEIEI